MLAPPPPQELAPPPTANPVSATVLCLIFTVNKKVSNEDRVLEMKSAMQVIKRLTGVSLKGDPDESSTQTHREFKT